MTVLDASVVIAYLDPADQHHAAAVEMIAGVRDRLVVHALTMAEVLVHPTRVGIADEVWENLRSIGVTVHPNVIDPRRLAGIRVSSGCKMPDCCLLAAALDGAGDVLSLDDRLSEAAARLGVGRSK